ncbi:MAG: nucleotide exchange factor GrpE [Candidatus Accumulibacter sp.]|uniref:nucleotide exchange factor GrpE n=1 Tax=Accumulibacter sp. TaxID=2053492 RepID=UPI001AD1FBA3|nr:nucleotide exchange factor GrpE [Accumulibacter sp.]MBN8518717.1 nucleotide exchange factor GrpE [Accumulibacter sp.]MBO3711277.1 nucleotide exchange factor GrpE [Accumulibacter sp.]
MNSPVIVLDPEERARLVDDFRAALERAARQCDCEPAGEPDDQAAGDTETSVDLATLLSEMAVLKSELRLQSRQFKNTLDELRGFGNDLRQHGERLQRDLERAREQAASIQGQTERQFLLALLDLRDRLQSGVDAAGKPPSSFLTRLVPGPTRFAASLAEGQRLTLQRLDDLLASHRVRPLPVLGEILDPQRMRVVGVEAASSSSSVPDGTILREVRRGFLHNGELLRVAEVIVSKKATNP